MALKVGVTENRSFSRTLHLDGRLDSETAPLLDDELEKIFNSPVNVVVFDLANLQYISSAGLRSIFHTHKTMAQRSGRVALMNPRPQVKKVFEIVKATELAAVFTSVQELDDYLDAMQRKVIDGE